MTYQKLLFTCGRRARIMINWTGGNNMRIQCNKDVFTFLHNIALLDVLRIGSENFLLEAIIVLPEKQGGKRYISCIQHADKANLYVTKKGTAHYEIKPTFKYPITNKEVGTFIQCKCSDFFTEQD